MSLVPIVPIIDIPFSRSKGATDNDKDGTYMKLNGTDTDLRKYTVRNFVGLLGKSLLTNQQGSNRDAVFNVSGTQTWAPIITNNLLDILNNKNGFNHTSTATPVLNSTYSFGLYIYSNGIDKIRPPYDHYYNNQGSPGTDIANPTALYQVIFSQRAQINDRDDPYSTFIYALAIEVKSRKLCLITNLNEANFYNDPTNIVSTYLYEMYDPTQEPIIPIVNSFCNFTISTKNDSSTNPYPSVTIYYNNMPLVVDKTNTALYSPDVTFNRIDFKTYFTTRITPRRHSSLVYGRIVNTATICSIPGIFYNLLAYDKALDTMQIQTFIKNVYPLYPNVNQEVFDMCNNFVPNGTYTNGICFNYNGKDYCSDGTANNTPPVDANGKLNSGWSIAPSILATAQAPQVAQVAQAPQNTNSLLIDQALVFNTPTNTPAASTVVKSYLEKIAPALASQSTSEPVELPPAAKKAINSYYSGMANEFNPNLPLVVTTTTLHP